jgi:hypothetical protein
MPAGIMYTHFLPAIYVQYFTTKQEHETKALFKCRLYIVLCDEIRPEHGTFIHNMITAHYDARIITYAVSNAAVI